MECVKCRELRQTLEFKLGKYIEARASAYYRVSTELAAHKIVDMERSRDDLEEHQFACVSVVHSQATFGPPRNSAVVQEKEAAVWQPVERY
jgi:hypothetical protein